MKKAVLASFLAGVLILSSYSIEASETEMDLDAINEKIESLESELNELYEQRDALTESESETEVVYSSSYLENIYFWYGSSEYLYVGYEINNPTDYPIYFKIETVFLDEDSNAVGTDDDYVRCIGPQEKAFLISFNEFTAASINYSQHVEARSNLQSAQQYMDYSATENDGKFVFTVNNSSNETIQYAKITVVYFYDSKVISVYDSYLDGGTTGEIPGDGVAYEEFRMSKSYDSYQVYLTGYLK
ncbi:MAG: hypothetical protein LUF35_13265 [Lachnospiraceae bacterium]|nr:hypothetical protein [Lachnospiraceae bacterium]